MVGESCEQMISNKSQRTAGLRGFPVLLITAVNGSVTDRASPALPLDNVHVGRHCSTRNLI
jgi:hypothetical protein